MYFSSVLQDLNKFKPKISQFQAIDVVQNDLRRLHPDFSELYIVDDARHNYLSLSKFEQNHQHLQLVFVHKNGTILLVNSTDGKALVWYQCNDYNLLPYCSLVQPNNPDHIGELVYAVDLSWISTKGIDVPDLYIVDAMNGKIISSSNISNSTSNNR